MRQTLSRTAVVSTAREMLEAEGLEGVSLRRIASKLGVTAPALYAYVTDKADLLRAIAELELDGLHERFQAVKEPDPVERIRRYGELYLDYALHNAALFRAMFLFRPELTSESRNDRPALAERMLDVVVAAARDAVDQGRFGSQDPRFAAVTVWTAVHGVVIMMLSGPRLGGDDPHHLLAAVMNAVLDGLCRQDVHVGS